MIGGNIKRLRLEKGLTQKNLADKLFVSAQAVSRWENNEVEPSIGTIMELARIFEVTADEILGLESKTANLEDAASTKEEPKTDTEQHFEKKSEEEPKKEEPPQQMLALCYQCNTPIYEKNDIVRKDEKIYCARCHQSIMKQRKADINEKGLKRRIRSFVWGTLAAILALSASISTWDTVLLTFSDRAIGILFSLSLFTFISCCFLANNFVGYMFCKICTWSIKMPGLIFTFDLDGCLWFIGMKILFAIIGFVIGVLAFLFALFSSCAVSIFVYPYAIITNIKHPEKEF